MRLYRVSEYRGFFQTIPTLKPTMFLPVTVLVVLVGCNIASAWVNKIENVTDLSAGRTLSVNATFEKSVKSHFKNSC